MLAASGPWFSGPEASARTRYGHCDPPGRVVARSKAAVASISKSLDFWEVYGCVRRTGRAPAFFSGRAFGPPARSVAVHGHLVGYAYQELAATDPEPDTTWIKIADLRHGRPIDFNVRPRWGLRAVLPTYVKIASLDIDAHRRVAWIECPEPNDREEPDGSIRPDCVHPGASARVQLLNGPKAIRRGQGPVAITLAAGTDIDPRSIRITARRVLWTQAGHLRSARLPPLAT